MLVRANILCLVGAALGLVALITPWAELTMVPETTSTQVFGLIDSIYVDDFVTGIGTGILSYSLWLGVGAFAFLAGTALAFSTPIGGVGQAIGLTTTLVGGYFVGDPTFFGERSVGLYTWCVSAQFGIYMAAVSTLLVMISLVHPVFLGTRREAGLTDPRFLTWRLRTRTTTDVLRAGKP